MGKNLRWMKVKRTLFYNIKAVGKNIKLEKGEGDGSFGKENQDFIWVWGRISSCRELYSHLYHADRAAPGGGRVGAQPPADAHVRSEADRHVLTGTQVHRGHRVHRVQVYCEAFPYIQGHQLNMAVFFGTF